jgi:hypothetical protein
MTRISVAHRPDMAGGADKIVRVLRTVQSITAAPRRIPIAEPFVPADIQAAPDR